MILIYGNLDDEMTRNLCNICQRRSVAHKVLSMTDTTHAKLLYELGHGSNLPQVFSDLDYLGDCSDLVNYIEVVTKIEDISNGTVATND